ncbi:hypothetical protein IT400_02055 [Candidatus Nomurabacteria bacterium]|nr:hypothetical protein [Candidatus Nomurabacteria bacterium]
MNIHPIVVHFPIAFLFIWGLCEVLPVSKWFSSINWAPIKNFLVVIGFLGGWVAQMTGELAEELVGENKLVNTHSAFAQASMILFGIFAVEVIVIYIKNKYSSIYYKFGILARIIDMCLRLLQNKIFRILLVLLALIAIFVTGVLGGAIVYGTSADPLAPFVLKILGL